jgi:undecaprenyl-diphosphatase
MEILVKLRAYIITGLLLIISFVFTTVLVKTEKFSEFDKWLSSIIHNNRSSFLTNIMKCLDFIGSSYFVIGISLVILFYLYFIIKRRFASILFIITMLGERLLGEGLKYLLIRSRPDGPHLVEIDGHSFPSQHAMNAFVLYGILLFLLWTHLNHYKIKVLLSLLIITIILAMGVSRIYLGVHYPSDIFGGYLISGFWLTAVILYARYHKEKNKKA